MFVRKTIGFIALLLLIMGQSVLAKVEVTSDRNSLLINTPKGICSYSFEKGEDSLEFVCSNQFSGEEERVKCPGQTTVDLKAGPGETRAFALVQGADGRKLVVFELQPLRIMAVMDVSPAASRVFPVDKGHVALLNYNVKDMVSNQSVFRFVTPENSDGQLQYIDVEQKKVLQEYRFSPKWEYIIEWNSIYHVMTMRGVIYFTTYNGPRAQFEYNGSTVLSRISSQGMRLYELPSLTWSSGYDYHKDLFYILTSSKLEVIDCATSAKQTASIGRTWYQLVITVPEKNVHITTPYTVNIFSNQNRLVVFNVWNGDVRVIDTATLKVIKKLKAGRLRANIQEYAEDERTIVAVAKEFTRVYTLDQGGKKIRIFDEFLTEKGVLTISEKPLAMYDAKNPVIVTENAIYSIEDDSLKLARNLKSSTKKVFGLQLGGILFLRTDNEIIVFNSENGTIIN